MTLWLLVYIYFGFPIWQSFTYFWGSYEDFLGTPQNCAKIREFSIVSIFLLCHKRNVVWHIYDYYMNKMSSQWWRHDDVMLWRHNDVTSVPNCVIFKTNRYLSFLIQFSILLVVFVCLTRILHIFWCYFIDLLIFE